MSPDDAASSSPRLLFAPRGGVSAVDRIAREAAAFAIAETDASRLPGTHAGPADAYRHMIWAGEMTRRLGVLPAAVLLEGHEVQNWLRAQVARVHGRDVPHDYTPEARDLDRRNNAAGRRIGARAETAGDVVWAARTEIERGRRTPRAQPYTGAPGGASWLGGALWRNYPDEDRGNWPIAWWPDLERAAHVQAYPGLHAPSRYHARDEDGRPLGPVFVRPHMREGHPVRGHQRSAPGP